jgi:hypothetical protein
MYAEDSDEEATSQNASVASNKLLSKSDGGPSAKSKLGKIVHYKPPFFEVGIRFSLVDDHPISGHSFSLL